MSGKKQLLTSHSLVRSPWVVGTAPTVVSGAGSKERVRIQQVEMSGEQGDAARKSR